MDVVVTQIRRSETTVCIDLLSVPGLSLSTVRLHDSHPELEIRVHVSDRSLLLEYYKGRTSVSRVLFRRGTLQIAGSSSEPQPFYPQLMYDKHSPFRLFGCLRLDTQALDPELITYHNQLYRLKHYTSALRTTLHLSILSFDGEEQERFSIDCSPTSTLLCACPSRGETLGKMQLYGTYVTEWYVLMFGKEEWVGVWRYRTGTVEMVRMGKVRLKAWIAQRGCGEEAYFLDAARRIVILTSATAKIVNLQLYEALLPVLYLHLHKRLPLPKPLLQDLCLAYLIPIFPN